MADSATLSPGMFRCTPKGVEESPVLRPRAAGKMPLVIGVAGASASGKTTICAQVMRKLAEGLKGEAAGSVAQEVTVISTDQYYRTLSRESHEVAMRGDFNFDEPSAMDLGLMAQHLRALKHGEVVRVPKYDFVSHTREDEAMVLGGCDIVIVEGLFTLCDDPLRQELDIKVFTQEELDICLARRVRRDVRERGMDVEATLVQYERFVKPAYETFIRPSAAHADLIIPRAGDNEIATSLLVQWIRGRADAVSEPFEALEPLPESSVAA